MGRTIESLKSLFELDIERLKTEIESYEKNEDLWWLAKDINNTAGNLALHLCGNLQHFFGAVILENGYVRDRDFEFNGKDVTTDELLIEIQKSKKVVREALESLDEDKLEATYPLEVFGFPMTYNYFLIRLVGHLNYHLGQINYHRRLLDK